jgi:aryl-alcohol dehydrogenase-like predicted oxidoreductase
VEQSLRWMKTDYLDLVQFHRSLTRQEFEEHGAPDAALTLKKEGKVRFLGVSGTLPNLVEPFLWFAQRNKIMAEV